MSVGFHILAEDVCSAGAVLHFGPIAFIPEDRDSHALLDRAEQRRTGRCLFTHVDHRLAVVDDAGLIARRFGIGRYFSIDNLGIVFVNVTNRLIGILNLIVIAGLSEIRIRLPARRRSDRSVLSTDL